MGLKSKVFPNSYRDSVLLMKMAGMVRKIEGVENAEVIIATEANKGILEFNGLLTEEIRRATPNDLVVSVIAGDETVIEKAIAAVEDMIFNGLEDDKGGKVTYSAKSIAGALAMEPEADLAILSIPGPLVKKDAMKLLDSGVNLLIFSDNVPIEDELELKRKADEKGLMVMGPDCGTAIVRGASLAFANKVRQGKIGMVCASGTGLQEVAVLIHNLGQGISHALGTGSNDVKDAIGGISMKRGLKWLEQDGSTELIVVVSKPPQKATMENLKEEFKKCRKPVIAVSYTHLARAIAIIIKFIAGIMPWMVGTGQGVRLVELLDHKTVFLQAVFKIFKRVHIRSAIRVNRLEFNSGAAVMGNINKDSDQLASLVEIAFPARKYKTVREQIGRAHV